MRFDHCLSVYFVSIISNLKNSTEPESNGLGPPRGFWSYGERLFVFMELGSNSNYFHGGREQALYSGELGSTVGI